ncbi:MAG TPA: DUF72 domain-containing protein [Clostridia bacterium]|nr:DUF72 domain-containing protein [Clostridia bacterium]
MIYVGTSGYSYKDWVGPFYPADAKAGDMLGIYSDAFNFTEINSTYYKIPNAFMFYNMQKKTGDDFVFTVKLHQSMTHGRDAGDKDYEDFQSAADVLRQVRKLGCLVAQFPYSFYYNRENMEYIQGLKERFADFDMVVEFRNNRWVNDETMEFLKTNGLGYVCVDEPAVAGLPDRRAIGTSRVSYVRFHGRNDEKWWSHKEAYERYDYLYKESELTQWKDKLLELERQSENCFVSFNNHFRAQAVINGIMLKKMLGM